MPIRLGLIGLSATSDAWASAAHALPLIEEPLSSKYRLAAVTASSKESALASARTWDIPPEKAYASAEEMAADPDVDLVTVSVKLPLHRDVVLPILNAGKDVFVEWPLATNMEQVEELVDAAKRSGSRTVMGLQARTSPAILKAKEIIDSGKLGRIIATTVTGWDNQILYLGPRFAYEHDARSNANIVTITATHVLDALCFLLGEFKDLNASTPINFPEITELSTKETVHRDAPDALLINGTLVSGVNVSYSMVCTGPDTPKTITWTVMGTHGVLRMEGVNTNLQIIPPKLFFNDGSPGKGGLSPWEEIEVPESKCFGQVNHVYAAFAEGEKVPGSLVDFRGAALRHRMLEAIARSAEKGTRESYL